MNHQDTKPPRIAEDDTRRKSTWWVRIHLATLILLTLTAGLLVWANMPPADFDFSYSSTVGLKRAGWPMEAFCQEGFKVEVNGTERLWVPYGYGCASLFPVIVNLLVAVATLGVVAVASEQVIRRLN